MFALNALDNILIAENDFVMELFLSVATNLR